MTMDANIVIARREGVLLVANRALHGDQVWIVATACCTRARSSAAWSAPSAPRSDRPE
jgi:hypothetical protein